MKEQESQAGVGEPQVESCDEEQGSKRRADLENRTRFRASVRRTLVWMGIAAVSLLVAPLVIGLGFTSRYGGTYFVGAVLAAAIGLLLCFIRRARLATLCSAAFFVAALWFASLGPDRDELQREGNEFVAVLVQYRAANGLFPTSLTEAGCAPRWNRFGGWQYESLEQGTSYHLWVGEYEWDDFILYRYAKDARWHWDT